MTARAAARGKTLEVKQVRSGIGFDKKQKAILRALGLAKVGRVRVLPDNREVRGMLSKIPHLVVIQESSASKGEAATHRSEG